MKFPNRRLSHVEVDVEAKIGDEIYDEIYKIFPGGAIYNPDVESFLQHDEVREIVDMLVELLKEVIKRYKLDFTIIKREVRRKMEKEGE